MAFPMDIPDKELTYRIFFLAMDTGMYFSQVLLKSYPSLRWEQRIANKRFADYGQPLLAGFGAVSLNPVRIAHVIAHGLADGTYTGKRLREVYNIWAQRVGLAS
jgi:hypothetical protein